MKVSTMRQIDRLLGVPACFLLTAVRKLLPFLKKPRPQKVKSILFVKLAEQGATVLADAAIRRAVQMAGKENVYFLVFEQNRFILDVMDIIPQANVITIPDASFLSLLIGAIGAMRRIRKLRIDAAVDFEFFARFSAILTWLSGAGIRVGLHGFGGGAPYRGDLMTHRLNYNPHLHTSRMFEAMVEAIKLPAEETPRLNMDPPKPRRVESRFTPGREELNEFKAALENHAGTKNYSPLILLNANASDMLPLRRWPTQRYIELARRLIAKSSDVHIAFTGAPNEAEHSQKLVEAVASRRCFSMTGKTTLRQLMMLYCLADALVTNDSGPAHFATLTNIEVITLFGPETPRLFGAETPHSHIIWKDIPCSPCVSAYNNRISVCNDNICMKRISVDEVFDLLCGLCKL
ncbi:MAG: glycosyltransferase family 9 protein [Sedimentisphaerales bacterium]|nr:glycosyltransferase family 9 protein [Sedimentisphaerales bacterium]